MRMGFSTGGPGPDFPRRPQGNELFSLVFSGGAISFLPVSLADGVGWPAADSNNLPEGSYNCTNGTGDVACGC